MDENIDKLFATMINDLISATQKAYCLKSTIFNSEVAEDNYNIKFITDIDNSCVQESANFKPDIDNLTKEKEQTPAFLNFTQQEILKMPKQIRKEFRVDGCTARITKRKSGKNGFCYEIRYRRNGYNISVSSTNLQAAKDKFITALSESVQTGMGHAITKTPTKFHEFTMYFFENYRKGKITDVTYKSHLRTYEKYIQNHLGQMQISHINPTHCKLILDKILNNGYGRLRECVHSILNQVFNMAIAHGIISRNPLAVLVYDKHEREHGKPISKADEKRLLSAFSNTDYLVPFALLLYTGVRPNELYTTKIDGNFIVANNSKRKTKKKEFKRIAVSQMLLPYLSQPFNSIQFPKKHTLVRKLKEILPNHTLKDCRMTFSTRSQECGVDRTVVKVFMGHSLSDMLGQHYTEFSDEYLLKEAQKIKY